MSSLSLLETADIVGHYNRLVSNNDNNSVWDAYRERGISEDQIAVLKEQVKEQVGRDISGEFKSMGLQFTTSLDEFECGNLGTILTMYELWEKGQVPDEGCLLDQVNKTVEIMNLINGLRNEQMEKMNKQHQKEMTKARK